MLEALIKDYPSLLREGIAQGRVQSCAAEDKRQFPRFRLDGDTIQFTVGYAQKIVDISRAGLAFHSPVPFEVGQQVPLCLKNVVWVGAVVVGCDPVETDAAQPLYKVRFHFENEAQGHYLLSLALDLENEAHGAHPGTA